MEYLFRYLPKPFGNEGLPSQEICAHMTGTPAHIWLAQIEECNKIIANRAHGYTTALAAAFFLWFILQVLQGGAHIIIFTLKQHMCGDPSLSHRHQPSPYFQSFSLQPTHKNRLIEETTSFA